MLQKEDIAKKSVLDKAQVLSAVIDYAKDNGSSIAIWREPGDEIYFAIDDAHTKVEEDITLEDVPTGFLFAPFEKEDSRYFIRGEQLYNLSKVADGSQEVSKKIQTRIEIPSSKGANKFSSSISEVEDNYTGIVEEAIGKIKAGTLHKVVPSRIKKLSYIGNLNLGERYLKLCRTYKQAFCSLVYTPDTGVWMGASPELLIHTNQDQFKTVSLAGTQPLSGSMTDLAWTQKEIEEQAYVNRYIVNCFKQIRLREFDEHGPKTIKAGNLAHLKTVYTVDMKATGFHNLGSVMLKLLHPTSAICGMPLEPSLKFIRQHETHPREFFSGYLGPVNQKDHTSLYVNLRCMKVTEHEITLFAGAGITEDSSPEKEWKETELKMNTILKVLENE